MGWRDQLSHQQGAKLWKKVVVQKLSVFADFSKGKKPQLVSGIIHLVNPSAP